MAIYTTMFILGIVFIVVSLNFFMRGSDYIGVFGERITWNITTTEIPVPIVGGSIVVNVAKNDRLAAWRIYSQISTRIAAVEFDENIDSALLVHESLHKVFEIIREEIANIPVERLRGDKADNTVKFYLDILNQGIRPHLSAWHIPLQKFVENEQKVHANLSVLEIEKKFPKRKELLESMKLMNGRMKKYADSLLIIAKGSKP